MTIASRIALATAACAALAGSGAAHASANGYAEFSGFTVSLVDLRPDDGIDPSFTLFTQAGSTTISGVGNVFFSPSPAVGGLFDLLQPSQMEFGAVGSALSRTATLDNMQIVSTAGNGVYGITFAAGPGQAGEGRYLGAAGLVSASIYNETAGADTPGMPLIEAVDAQLSPYTSVVITANLAMHLDGTLDCENCVLESHSISGYIGVQKVYPEGSDTTVNDWRSLSFEQYGDDPLREFYNASTDAQLRVEYLYTGNDAPLALSLVAGVAAGGQWQAGPIPEPGTYALVGLGLGAAAWQARRRKPAAA